MANFKLVISDPKTGKSIQKEVKDDMAKPLIGLKIKDTIKGEVFDLSGYEFQITGGSDHCGFPMRWDVAGVGRKKIYAVRGVGVVPYYKFTKKGERKIRRKAHGVKLRKNVCGNTIHAKTAQINLKILKYGKTPLAAEKPAEGAAEKPKEAK